MRQATCPTPADMARPRIETLERWLRFLLVGCAAATGGFAETKISAGLLSVHEKTFVDVIVQYRHISTERHHGIVREKGGVVRKTLEVVNGAQYWVPASALAALAADPEVVYISPRPSTERHPGQRRAGSEREYRILLTLGWYRYRRCRG